jgi:hypothetical protein
MLRVIGEIGSENFWKRRLSQSIGGMRNIESEEQ